jgi:hypothetical protein
MTEELTKQYDPYSDDITTQKKKNKKTGGRSSPYITTTVQKHVSQLHLKYILQ